MKPKVGEKITLDLGYAPQSDFQECKIIEVRETYGLFLDPQYTLLVEEPNGNYMSTSIPRTSVL